MKKLILASILIIFSIILNAQDISSLIDKARNGDVKSQLIVAESYMNAEMGVDADTKKAYYWAKKAALKNYAPAQSLLAEIIMYDLNYEEEEGYSWAKKAADRGDEKGKLLYGSFLYEGFGCQSNKTKGRKIVLELAQGNNYNAMVNIIEILSIEQNYTNVLYWLKKCATNNKYPAFQFQLGLAYLNYFYNGEYYINKNIQKIDEKKAIYWIEQAAKNGSEDAQYFYGLICYYGNSEELEDVLEYSFKTKLIIDKEEGLYWLQKSSDQGYEDAKIEIEIINEE